MAAAKPRQRILVKRAERLARDRDRARVGTFQPGHDHQQGRFAGAGRADHSDRLALSYMEVDVLEDMHAERVLAERQIDPGERDRGSGCAWKARGVVHAVDPWGMELVESGERPAPPSLVSPIWELDRGRPGTRGG